MMGGGRLLLVLSLPLLRSALCVAMPSSCASDRPPEIGQASTLMQVSKHTNAAVPSHTDKANAASVEKQENEKEVSLETAPTEPADGAPVNPRSTPPVTPTFAPTETENSRLQQKSSDHGAAAAEKFHGSWLKLSRSATSNDKNPPHKLLAAQKGQARAILKPSLFDVGIQLLGSEDTLDVVVANTKLVDVQFSGETLRMRLVVGEGGGVGDNLLGLGMGVDSEYGMNSLGTLEPNSLGMLEMMDVGANVGAVSIAAFKKEGKRLRIVAVEPNPSTYFLFLWNLFLNDVPQLSLQAFHDNPTQAGVLAINKGVAPTDNQVVGLCYTPPQTSMARICNCSVQTGVGAFQSGSESCANVVSSTFDSLLGIFNGSSQLTYVKVDCEGCEDDLLPALSRYTATPAWKLGQRRTQPTVSVYNS